MTPVAVDLAASEGMHRLPLFASFWSDVNVNSSIVFKSMTQRERIGQFPRTSDGRVLHRALSS